MSWNYCPQCSFGREKPTTLYCEIQFGGVSRFGYCKSFKEKTVLEAREIKRGMKLKVIDKKSKLVGTSMTVTQILRKRDGTHRFTMKLDVGITIELESLYGLALA